MENIKSVNQLRPINSDEIRKKAIIDIKEKVKTDPGYLHPCNRERLEDMKRLGFVCGNEFSQWMQQNRIMKNPTEIWYKKKEKAIKDAGCKTEKEYRNKRAQISGFKDCSERHRDYMHKTGRCLPVDFNEDCPGWFGEFTENLMIHRYPGAKNMPPNNPGFDYLWNGIEIDNKGRCLRYTYTGNSPIWEFPIRWNNKAKKFILSGWDNRENLNPLNAWEFNRDDIVRERPFWQRISFSISYTPEGLEQFEEYQIDIDWLKDLIRGRSER